MISIFTAGTFNFLLNSHFFFVFLSLLVSDPWEFTYWMARKTSNFPLLWLAVLVSPDPIRLVGLYTHLLIQTQDKIHLEINKKRRSSIDLDIHNSKVFSSELETFVLNIYIIPIVWSRYSLRALLISCLIHSFISPSTKLPACTAVICGNLTKEKAGFSEEWSSFLYLWFRLMRVLSVICA